MFTKMIDESAERFCILFFFLSSLEDLLIDFLERGKGGKERERNIDVKNIYRLLLICAPTRE